MPSWCWLIFRFCITEIGRLSHPVPIALLHLAFFLSAWKLLTRASDRDDICLFLLSFAALLSAAVLSLDLTFLACLLLFLAFAISSLILFEMRRSSARALRSGHIRPLVVPGHLRGTRYELFAGFPAGHLAVLTLVLTGSITALAVPLFMLIPRVTLRPHRPVAPAVAFISGFSETVKLGAIGNIKESREPVMKVRVDVPPSSLPADLKWRGIALDHYDHGSWRRSRTDRDRIPMQAGYFKLAESSSGTNLLSQTVYLEPIATDVVFGSHRILAVSNDLGGLEQDAAGNIFSVSPRSGAIRYTAVSDITRPDPRLIEPIPWHLPRQITECCLDPGEQDPRVAALARRVTASAKSPFEQARSLEAYLRTSYGYSLELKGPEDSRDPLAMFLFTVRRGHCEYFATAMAVMLRQLGIPSRLVNGFRAGEYNPWSDHWTVRQCNAHSWVEAYFPPYGWVEFDPTPADPAVPETDLMKAVKGFFDALDLWWSADVVNYDLRRQARFVEAGRAWASDFQRAGRDYAGEINHGVSSWLEAGRWREAPWGVFIVMTAALLAGASLIRKLFIRLARRGLHAFRRRTYRRDHGALITDIYMQALAMVEDLGWGRSRSQTPAEFARELAQEPFGETLSLLTALYNRARFGGQTLDEDAGQAQALLRKLRLARPGGHRPGLRSGP